MKLTDGERLIVVMLADIMEEMGVNREIDPTLVKRLAVSRDDWAIQHRYDAIFGGESPDKSDVDETHQILSMWSYIEFSIDQLTGSEAAEAAKFHNPQFSGFDGNNDPHFGIAQTLINDLGLYSEFLGRKLNSHSRTSLLRYRGMLPKYDAHMDAAGSNPLGIDALRDLLG